MNEIKLPGTFKNVVLRALAKIPLALGILLIQISLGTFADCCGAGFSPFRGLK